MMDLLTGPLKDWMPALIAGVFSLIVLTFTVDSKKRAELRGRMAERERAELAAQHGLREVEMTVQASQSQDLTQRFRLLLENYENRLRDMATELAACKLENRVIDKAYDDHRAICHNCPHFAEIRSKNATPSA